MTATNNDQEWRPKPTIGAVPRRVDSYKFFPISLPKTPPYAREPHVRALGKELLKRVMVDQQRADLPDPWSRHYAWRKHPYFSPMMRLKKAFPGLGIAIVAFTIYVGLEKVGVLPSAQDHH